MPLKPADIVIILIALGITCFVAFKVYIKPQNSAQILIQGRWQKWIFPLEAEETVNVPGPLGETVVRIHNRQVWVESSPCTNQICVAAGHKNTPTDIIAIACLPNNVIILIKGNDESANVPDTTAW